MRERKICTGTICCVPIDVFVTDGDAGSFNMGARFVKVGIGGTWRETLAALLHETYEAVAAMLDCRFANINRQVYSDSYVFHFDHNKFSAINEEAATFLVDVLPNLSSAWAKKHKRNKMT